MPKPPPEPAAPTTVALSLLDQIPQPELVEALQGSDDARFVQLAETLLDPRHSRTSFTTTLRKLKIPLGDFIDMWRKYNLNVGLARMYAQVPQVLADTVADATTTTRRCTVCMGDRTVPDPRKGKSGMVSCPGCSGSGIQREVGDLASRKLIFETAELTGKGGPAVVIDNSRTSNVTNQTAHISLAFRDTIEQANRVLDLGPARRDDLIEAVAEADVQDALLIEGTKTE